MNIFIIGTFLTALSCIGATDLPCIPRDGEPGQSKLCVCNSTYCDTIEQPSKLDKTQFHFYKTSNSTPGFTHTTQEFSQDATSGQDTDAIVFTIDATQKFQEFVGLGGAISDAVGMLYNSFSTGTQDNFMKSYFGPSSIEYSMIRIPIGSTDFGERKYTLDDVDFDDDLSHFSLPNEDYIYRIPLIKRAMNISERAIKLSACSWISPTWMRNKQSPYAAYIADKYNALWATYNLKFLEGYRQNGLELWSLSTGNEPFMLYVIPLDQGTLNVTLSTADGQAIWLKKHLKPQLVAANFSDVKLLAFEDQTLFIFYWMDAFRVDPEARAAVDGMGLHWYSDWFIPDSYYRAAADLLHKTYPDQMFLYTEGSINGGFGSEAVQLGSWYRAEGYIYRLYMMLDNWNVAFIDWNLIVDPQGGPTKTFGVECPVVANTTSDEFYKQPIFYGIGHFSKFIQPGAVKVQVNSNQKTKSTNEENFDPKSVMENLSSLYSKRKLTGTIFPPVTIPQATVAIAVTNPDDSFTVIVINTQNVTVPVKVVDSRVGTISLEIENNSINSFIYWP